MVDCRGESIVDKQLHDPTVRNRYTVEGKCRDQSRLRNKLIVTVAQLVEREWS